MPSKTADITYVQHDVPAGSPVPASWWFSLWDQAGAQVGAEQVFPSTVAEVTVSAPAGSGYTIKGGQRDAAGTELGTPVVSPPFDLEADITISFVGSITIKVG